MDEFTSNIDQAPDADFLNSGRDNRVPVAADNDYNREFIYEDAERISGAPYFNRLRSQDNLL